MRQSITLSTLEWFVIRVYVSDVRGRRGSGIGSTLGREGILAFVKPKSWHFIKP